MAVIATARTLRKRMSPPEARLWVALRAFRKAGYHFRRQHPLSGYFLDFVCMDRRLIVEVDGRSHDPARDGQRDAALARLGFRTLRFDNAAVRDDLHRVTESILAELDRAAPTRPLRGHPPPRGEGD